MRYVFSVVTDCYYTFYFYAGYENQDWFIPSPALQIDEADLKLSPDQIRETLNYFRKLILT